MSQFENVTAVKAANIYYDGKVTSRTLLFADGSKKTLGILLPGDYESVPKRLKSWRCWPEKSRCCCRVKPNGKAWLGVKPSMYRPIQNSASRSKPWPIIAVLTSSDD